MRSRPAVLLTPSIAARLSRPSCAVEHTFCATNVPRGAEKSPKRSLFDGWPGRPFPYLVTSLLPFSLFLKSFSRNTYGSPRKCCKQKTYGMAKPFRCNTYKKQGVGTPSLVGGACQPAWASLPRSPSAFNCRLSTSSAPLSTGHGSRVTDHASFSSFSPYFVTSLLHYFQKRRRPSRSDGAAAKRACRLQERRSFNGKFNCRAAVAAPPSRR